MAPADAGFIGLTAARATMGQVTIIAAADGSALGNPGPAGWAWYIDEHRWAAGGWPYGTNNQGELTAVLDLLQQTAHLGEDLLICCDSQYVINSITRWMPGWKRRGWRKGDRKPVLNVELMRALDAEMTGARSAGRRVEFRWVKGHAGHPLNERADRLANGAAAAYQAGLVPDPGPGIPGGVSRHPERGPAAEASRHPEPRPRPRSDQDPEHGREWPIAPAEPSLFDDLPE